jgi:uncharacterized cupredoxin-like copper-binding protein
MNRFVFGFFSIGALVAVLGLSTPAIAGVVVHVTLDDKTADMDMSLKLGMALKGDMSKATMSLKVVPSTAAAGEVTFEVKNVTQHSVVHEMILAAVPDTSKVMPYLDNESRVDEDKAGDLGEVSELEAGKSGSLTVTLKPGTYLLYCNVPGHFMSGMWTTITVK